MFTRHLSKTLLRRTSTQLTYHATVSSKRCFGAAARKPNVIETNTESADLIRDYIKGLMEKEESDELILKPITDEELDHGFQQFQVRTLQLSTAFYEENSPKLVLVLCLRCAPCDRSINSHLITPMVHYRHSLTKQMHALRIVRKLVRNRWRRKERWPRKLSIKPLLHTLIFSRI